MLHFPRIILWCIKDLEEAEAGKNRRNVGVGQSLICWQDVQDFGTVQNQDAESRTVSWRALSSLLDPQILIRDTLILLTGKKK